MPMRVDGERIKREREQRAWSQEQLASIAGLALRTVQRVETTGVASLESLRSLASAFSLDVADFRIGGDPPGQKASPIFPTTAGRKLIVAACWVVGSIAGQVLYQLVRHGAASVDWGRTAFVGLFVGFVWLLVLPVMDSRRSNRHGIASDDVRPG